MLWYDIICDINTRMHKTNTRFLLKLGAIFRSGCPGGMYFVADGGKTCELLMRVSLGLSETLGFWVAKLQSFPCSFYTAQDFFWKKMIFRRIQDPSTLQQDTKKLVTSPCPQSQVVHKKLLKDLPERCEVFHHFFDWLLQSDGFPINIC